MAVVAVASTVIVGVAAGPKPLGISTMPGLTTARSTTMAGSSLRIVQQLAFKLRAGAECCWRHSAAAARLADWHLAYGTSKLAIRTTAIAARWKMPVAMHSG